MGQRRGDAVMLRRIMLSKPNIKFRAKHLQEELEEPRTGCSNHDWGMVIEGVGDLVCVILVTVVELGISIDVLLNRSMIEGTMTLGVEQSPTRSGKNPQEEIMEVNTDSSQTDIIGTG